MLIGGESLTRRGCGVAEPPPRWPNPKELKATEVLSLLLTEGSAKVRSGPPGDDEPDYELETWAGVVPITTTRGEPIPDPLLSAGIATPDHVRALTER
jgi:hypothetical protein